MPNACNRVWDYLTALHFYPRRAQTVHAVISFKHKKSNLEIVLKVTSEGQWLGHVHLKARFTPATMSK